MKLLRHLLAVALVVGAVVALGFVWSASGAASIVADGGGGRFAPAGGSPGSTAEPRVSDLRGGGGFALAHVDDLVQTLLILGLITVTVVVIDKARRRYRPSRFPPRRTATER